MFAGENVTLWVKHFLEKTSAVHALIKESTVFQQLPTSAIKVVGRTQHILDMVNQYHQGPAIIGKCSYRGNLYGEGALFQLQGGCKECVCRSGRWNCNALTCNAAKSKAKIPSAHHAAHLQTGFLSFLSLIMYTLYFLLLEVREPV